MFNANNSISSVQTPGIGIRITGYSFRKTLETEQKNMLESFIHQGKKAMFFGVLSSVSSGTETLHASIGSTYQRDQRLLAGISMHIARAKKNRSNHVLKITKFLDESVKSVTFLRVFIQIDPTFFL